LPVTYDKSNSPPIKETDMVIHKYVMNSAK